MRFRPLWTLLVTFLTALRVLLRPPNFRALLSDSFRTSRGLGISAGRSAPERMSHPPPPVPDIFALLSVPPDQLKMEEVKRVLSNKELVNARGRFDEETPLHVAASEGHVEAVQLMLALAPQHVNARDNVGYTPLHWAAGKGHVAIVQALVKARADVNTKDKNDVTPLHRAAYWGQTEAVRALLEGGANSNAVDRFNHTPFMMATWFGKLDAAREIFDKMDRAQITLPNAWGKTPLEWAREANRQEVEGFILRRYRQLGIPHDATHSDNRARMSLSNQSSPKVPASPLT